MVIHMSLSDFFKKVSRERPAPSALSAPQWIICGLGNPGKKYETSRHNTGFAFMDLLSNDLHVTVDRLKFKSLCAQAEISFTDTQKVTVLLLKPQTFMNNSGEAVRKAADFYKIPPDKIIVVYDDVSLPEGSLRIRAKGSDGGHNGIKSIIYHLHTDVFPRIKIGVGSPKNTDYDMVAWVLGRPDEENRKNIYAAAKDSVSAVKDIIFSGINFAASRHNGTHSV